MRYLKHRSFIASPIWASFDVTLNCTSKCEYCSNWKVNHKDLTTEEVKLVLFKLKEIGVIRLCISGGEPLLRKDIVDIVRFAKELGFSIDLTTNGAICNANLYGDLIGAGLDSISFSIDGVSAETHERFRKNSSFERVVESIKTMIRIRDEKRDSMQVNTITVVTKENISELRAISNLRKELGIDKNDFQPVWEVKADTDFRDRFGFKNEDKELLKQARAVLRDIPSPYPKRYYDLIPDYYTNYAAVRKIECFAGRAFVYVNAEGNLYPCAILLEPFGSMVKDEPSVFLRSKRAKSIMRRAAVQNCRGCSLGCFMGRNIILESITNPVSLSELIYNRFLK